MGRDSSDEAYVADLCDRILGETALRQHRFDWLLGDPTSAGRRARLPVDACSTGLRLVVEYREIQHDPAGLLRHAMRAGRRRPPSTASDDATAR